MIRSLLFLLALAGLGLLSAPTARAQYPVAVGNPSFEFPETSYAGPLIDAWQKTPKRPDFIEEPPLTLWDYLTGVFLNPAPGVEGHKDETLQGSQALFLFNETDNGVYQDLEAVFEPGRFYSLTVGMVGGGGGMTEGTTLELALYYVDGGEQFVVSATTITHSLAIFSAERTTFVDCHLHTSTVQPGDPWAGKPIGIRMISTVPIANVGGFWDMDNVRLYSGPAPVSIVRSGTSLELSWPSLKNYIYQLQTSGDLSAWDDLGDPLKGNGGTLSLTRTLPAGTPRQFFRAAVVPAPSPAP